MILSFSDEMHSLSYSLAETAPWHFVSTSGTVLVGLTERVDQLETAAPFAAAASQDKRLFYHLLGQWHAERGVTSSLTDIFLCPSHLRIIAMGERAVPLILAQLRAEGDDPDLWFTALKAITGHDPVPEGASGDTLKMAEAWLSWAEGQYVW